jgi:hypothetical protein
VLIVEGSDIVLSGTVSTIPLPLRRFPQLLFLRTVRSSSSYIKHAIVTNSMATNTLIWDRKNWVTYLGNRPGYERPGNVFSGMLSSYPPEPLGPSPAKPLAGKGRSGGNFLPFIPQFGVTLCRYPGRVRTRLTDRIGAETVDYTKVRSEQRRVKQA